MHDLKSECTIRRRLISVELDLHHTKRCFWSSHGRITDGRNRECGNCFRNFTSEIIYLKCSTSPGCQTLGRLNDNLKRKFYLLPMKQLPSSIVSISSASWATERPTADVLNGSSFPEGSQLLMVWEMCFLTKTFPNHVVIRPACLQLSESCVSGQPFSSSSLCLQRETTDLSSVILISPSKYFCITSRRLQLLCKRLFNGAHHLPFWEGSHRSFTVTSILLRHINPEKFHSSICDIADLENGVLSFSRIFHPLTNTQLCDGSRATWTTHKSITIIPLVNIRVSCYANSVFWTMDENLNTCRQPQKY